MLRLLAVLAQGIRLRIWVTCFFYKTEVQEHINIFWQSWPDTIIQSMKMDDIATSPRIFRNKGMYKCTPKRNWARCNSPSIFRSMQQPWNCPKQKSLHIRGTRNLTTVNWKDIYYHQFKSKHVQSVIYVSLREC